MFVCVFLPSPLQSKSTESLDANLFLSSHLVCSVVVIFFIQFYVKGKVQWFVELKLLHLFYVRMNTANIEKYSAFWIF